MIVSINQPAYLPWLGYFHRVACSDLHVKLNHVQFEKNSFTNRNKVRTPTGWTWLTVPVQTKGKFGSLPINEVQIAENVRWAQKHWRTLVANYANAPAFADHEGFFQDLYSQRWTKLENLIDYATMYLLESLDIETPVTASADMNLRSNKGHLVLEICKEVGATTYLSGPLGRDYLDSAAFLDAGIDLMFHDYAHPVYEQRFSGFEPSLSVVDLLLNQGPASRQILMGSAS